MIYNLPIADVLHQETLLSDDFNSNFEGWEIVDNEDEKSFVKDSHFWMENKTASRWMFYHKKMPIKKGENFIIQAEIELLSHRGYGQFGLLWGFDKPHEVLNRFTVSVDSNRFSVCRFEKNYERHHHRFSTKFEKDKYSGIKQFFSIKCIQDYCYFFLHPQQPPVYICHRAHLLMDGQRFGFYVEPGIMMRCDKIAIDRLIVNQEFDGRPPMQASIEFMTGS